MGGNPLYWIDPLGLEVSAVLDTSTQTITVTDVDTGATVTASAFTGGRASSDGTIISPGIGPQIPAPNGQYSIVDNPNPTPGHEDWYGLFKNDDRMDDYFEDGDKERSGVRLHLGGLSYGCATVNRYQDDADKLWRRIRQIINSTKKSKIDFVKGPHWWNSTGKITKYGTLTIK